MAFVAALAASLVVVSASGGSAAEREASYPPTKSCGSLMGLSLPRTTVDSAVEDPGDATTPPSCRVTLTVADPVDQGAVTVWVYLPTRTWNGRFQGVGGGGFLGGDPARLIDPLRAGYAAAATDTGHVGNSAEFALDQHGRLNWPGIEDFGHEGIQDMTTAGKAVVAAYYGRHPAYSYFNGCSTGGRQGVMEAQRHPDEYDGILAGAPVINFPEMQTGQLWGQIVMLEQQNPVAPCKFEAAVTAMVDACDTVGDGVRDGVIGEPLACDFDPAALIGRETPCGPITAADVDVMRKIGEGPRRADGGFLWYGLAPGAPFAGLNDTVEVDGRLVGKPFEYDLWWFSLFLAQDRSFDWTSLTYRSFEAFFDQADQMYSDVLGADAPDLSAFQEAGGKMLLWHGKADFGVPFQGTVDYYERVQDRLGSGRTQQFLRLFLAPGVGHCGGGAGPAPADPLGALVKWVEGGKAPRTLEASRVDDGQVTQTRPICMYPFVARWTGWGDANDESAYRCVPGTRLERPRA
ncbi:tannase/feruloyl esterase family alpha/beta hydrolase [Saccharopolyspora sp. K220]|uniref:tannase/feruloyl esterase family alpha/beta hydrolase n=1 Tax=Saccharopolyspora soli TaxID=2926618 RepID=UPI001F56C10E|nr:tannase/feruloyl esterase family alpha/beta hydrolase [Saccharopolyspora soli]MCI2418441.1 tannase/feruloyl esterase family alpha/beta hydrolase [Saccharopolyspora soli]